jgi:hypothetical protein
MCTVLLPPGDNPIAVNKYIIYKQYFKYRNYAYIVSMHPLHEDNVGASKYVEVIMIYKILLIYVVHYIYNNI